MNTLPPGNPPLVNAQLVGVPLVVPFVTRLIVEPAETAAEAPEGVERVAKGVMARLEPVGQDEMKDAARVNTERIPKGVSKAEGTAAALEAVRMNV